MVETIICLLPSNKGLGSFLLKLLKVAISIGANESLRKDLVKKINLKLHEASMNEFFMNEKSNSDMNVEKNESDMFILYTNK